MPATPFLVAIALASPGPADCVGNSADACPVQEVPVAAPEGSDVVATEPEGAVFGPPAEAGDIVVTAENEAPEGDPAEELNAAVFSVSQAVDSALVEPIADAYEGILPRPVRSGIGNFLANLGEPVNALHFFLQFRPVKAFKSLGRFAINSTLGIGGLIDVAKREPFDLAYEDNGLANTLGYYGIGPGPYLYAPGFGSTTVRDMVGRIVDIATIPAVLGRPFNQPKYTMPIAVLNVLDHRVEVDDQVEAIRAQCGDPYAASRDIYLAKRRAEIAAMRGRQVEGGTEIDRLVANCDFTVDGVKVDFAAERAKAEGGNAGQAQPIEPDADTAEPAAEVGAAPAAHDADMMEVESGGESEGESADAIDAEADAEAVAATAG